MVCGVSLRRLNKKRRRSLNQHPGGGRSSALRRRNATTRCQPRPSAWVPSPQMNQNPNGVARFDGDVRWIRRLGSCCWIHRVVRASIIRGDWFLLSVANFGPPRWGYISCGGVANPGRWPGLTSDHPIRGFGIVGGRSCLSWVGGCSARLFVRCACLPCVDVCSVRLVDVVAGLIPIIV